MATPPLARPPAPPTPPPLDPSLYPQLCDVEAALGSARDRAAALLARGRPADPDHAPARLLSLLVEAWKLAHLLRVATERERLARGLPGLPPPPARHATGRSAWRVPGCLTACEKAALDVVRTACHARLPATTSVVLAALQREDRPGGAYGGCTVTRALAALVRRGLLCRGARDGRGSTGYSLPAPPADLVSPRPVS